MGLKKMLAQGAEKEHEQLNKASNPAAPIEESVNNSEPIQEEVSTMGEVFQPESELPPQKENVISSDTMKKIEKRNERKNPGGRRPNKEKGIKNRKQYTLTLKEDTYKMIMEEAEKEELSFAKFMERAAKEYINNHS